MYKAGYYAYRLIPLAMAGDPAAIAILLASGIAICFESIKDKCESKEVSEAHVSIGSGGKGCL